MADFKFTEVLKIKMATEKENCEGVLLVALNFGEISRQTFVEHQGNKKRRLVEEIVGNFYQVPLKSAKSN